MTKDCKQIQARQSQYIYFKATQWRSNKYGENVDVKWNVYLIAQKLALGEKFHNNKLFKNTLQ